MPLYAVTFEDKAGTTVPVRIRAATAEQAIAQAREPARYVTAQASNSAIPGEVLRVEKEEP